MLGIVNLYLIPGGFSSYILFSFGNHINQIAAQFHVKKFYLKNDISKIKCYLGSHDSN